MARGNIGADHALCRRVKNAGCGTRLFIVAARAFQNEAARGCGMSGVTPCRIFQQRRKAFPNRTIRPQDIGKRNCFRAGIEIKNPLVEAHLATECGIEARRVDA